MMTILHDMILEVYNTEDYATKVSEYVMNDYQNAEEHAKRVDEYGQYWM